jgi:peptidyl-tRNA hydrolase ICT1
MLHNLVFKSLSTTPLRGKLALLQECRSYSSRPDNETEAADLDAARQWFRQFDKSTIPIKIAKTSFSRSSGPGGQKTNKCVIRNSGDWTWSNSFTGPVQKRLLLGL